MTTPAPTKPPRLPIANALRVAHWMTCSGQNIVLTHGLKTTAQANAEAMAAVSLRAADAFVTHLMPQISDNATYVKCRVEDPRTNGLAAAEYARTGTGGGVGLGGALSVAAIISHRTARAGKSYRGRTYFGPLHSAALNDDGRTLTTGARNAFRTAWLAYNSAVLAGAGVPAGTVFAVLSHRTGTAEEIINITVQDVVGTQRGRLR